MLFLTIDILGTAVFAISGFLGAFDKRLDFFGGSIIALVTAIGGGSIRDVLLGVTPVGWLSNRPILYAIFGGIFIALLFRKHLLKLRKTMMLFDTLGISLFTVLGTQVSLSMDIAPVSAVLLGTSSAVAGGVIRDTLCNEIPLVFKGNLFYATPCILGGFLYWILLKTPVNTEWSAIIAMSFIFTIRILAVRFKWKIPELV
ncbi:trimeric intracellular cation channel family protein [Luteibaculum oceani]|uniref:Trimeric intracellular cation channel family protein n=1 Tax=Luteibaculum oceani TaxID=1294296 RepID=A0A5C6UQG3_9FLAO|nr:trimeric intracellular cation channel family protein [Luteibaculum oceani]